MSAVLTTTISDDQLTVGVSGREARSEKVVSVNTANDPLPQKVPPFYLWTHVLFITLTAGFSILLTLNSLGIPTLHPFLLIVGVLGSLGLVIPVMIDIREWKRATTVNVSTEAKAA